MVTQPEEPSHRGGIQVIARAADVLRALQRESEGLTLAEIAIRVALARSTVQRIVQALVDEEFVVPLARRGRFKLGPGLIRLAGGADMDVAQLSRSIIQELSNRLGETVDLSVLRNGTAVFIEQVQGNQRLVALSRIGAAFPLHCTANGKAMLAALPVVERSALLGRSLQRFTPGTILALSVLEQQLDQCRLSGVAFDIEEHAEGISAIGAAFFDSAGKTYAISVPVPSQRFKASQGRLEGAIREARDVIVDRISGSLPV